jgi:hypothetical protein
MIRGFTAAKLLRAGADAPAKTFGFQQPRPGRRATARKVACRFAASSRIVRTFAVQPAVVEPVPVVAPVSVAVVESAAVPESEPELASLLVSAVPPASSLPVDPSGPVELSGNVSQASGSG